MKNKIFTLLLVVSLMVAFTVTSFANYTKGKCYGIDPNETISIEIDSKVMTSDDDHISFTVESVDPTDSYKVTIFDERAQVVVFEKTFQGELYPRYTVDNINTRHTHIVSIENLNDYRIKPFIEIRNW
ncbi:hypothetical protein [Wukongibacter sp. M2B1]|uniref:hypothetical protein n=1 Tax=Wukongibacter sp. M2B1 TaxID=3088895 RepID=UPI003D7B2F1A